MPALAVAPDGTVYGFTEDARWVGRRRRTRRRPGCSCQVERRRQDWSTSVINPGAPYVIGPTAAVGPRNGNLHVVWDGRGATQADPSQAYFRASAEGDATWATPRRLPDDDIARPCGECGRHHRSRSPPRRGSFRLLRSSPSNSEPWQSAYNNPDHTPRAMLAKRV